MALRKMGFLGVDGLLSFLRGLVQCWVLGWLQGPCLVGKAWMGEVAASAQHCSGCEPRAQEQGWLLSQFGGHYGFGVPSKLTWKSSCTVMVLRGGGCPHHSSDQLLQKCILTEGSWSHAVRLPHWLVLPPSCEG